VNNESTDAVVVGGGPCGSLAAWRLAKLGVDVTVLEEHKEIGLPSHCAGHVSVDGLEHLRLRLPHEIFENEICGAVFYSPSGLEFRVQRSSPVTRVLNRELLDKHLAALAEKAGAQYFTGSRVKSLVSKAGVVTGVSIARRGANEIMTSSIVIDAEGFSSLLLKKAGLQTLDRSMVVHGIQVEVDKITDVDRNMVEVHLGQEYAPGFFAWIIPKNDGSAKVGLATKMGNPRDYLRKFMHKNPVASRKLRKSQITGLSMHPISLGGAIPKTYANGLLVVGDAASQVKPTTGGGIIFGLLCARIAGEVAQEAFEKRDFSEKTLSRYQFQWRKIVGFDLTMMLKLRKMLNRLSDDEMDKIINMCTKLQLNTVLEKAGDADFMGRSMLRMLPNPTTLTVALYFVFHSLVPNRDFKQAK
jgi:digeranylgeranylglycerophospholipid reductase